MAERLIRIENYLYNKGIELINYNFKSDNIKAMCSNDVIGLSDKVDTVNEKVCILEEEIAHIKLNVGNISDNRKEELKARAVAYNSLIGLDGIINSYNNGCSNLYDMADYLNVTENFLTEALEWYTSKYGVSTHYKNYKIEFVPFLSVKNVS